MQPPLSRGLARLCLLAAAAAACLSPAAASACSAGSGAEFMACLNATTGVEAPQLISITADIFLRPEDWQPYQHHLPIPTGPNSTVTVSGSLAAPPGGSPVAAGGGGNTGGSSTAGAAEAWTVLDFGGVLALSYHTAGTRFVMERLHIQGLATHAAGYAAAQRDPHLMLAYEMVNGIFWPTTTGDAGHLMVFRNASITAPPGTPCNSNGTVFKVQSMQQEAGGAADIEILNGTGPPAFRVGQLFTGSYPIRELATGSPAGRVLFSLEDVTISCPSGPPPPPGAAPLAPAPLASVSGTVLAGSAAELAHYLGVYDVSEIQLAGHIRLDSAGLAGVPLPLVIARGRNLTLHSADDRIKVLDFAHQPLLLQLEEHATLTLDTLELQGVAFPSAVYQNRSIQIEGSPLWPSVDGVPGHRLAFRRCALHEVATPCSHNSTQVQIDLLHRALGEAAVVRAGETTYCITWPSMRTVYFRDISTCAQLASVDYTYDNTAITCLEDPGVALASQLLATWTPQGAPNSTSVDSAGSDSSHVATLSAAIGAGVLGTLLAAAMAALLVRRRRRLNRAVATAAAVAVADAVDAAAAAAASPPTTPRLDSMEYGDLDEKLSPDLKEETQPLDSDSSNPLRALQAKNCSAAAKDTLWRSKFGVVEGLEVGDLLGRGAFGHVWRGRWNGALVAVKVVQHRVVGGTAYDVSREPLLSLSVSHPNAITTFKLTLVRVLTAAERVAAAAPVAAIADAAGPTRPGSSSGASMASAAELLHTPSQSSLGTPSRDGLVPASPFAPLALSTGSSGGAAAAAAAAVSPSGRGGGSGPGGSSSRMGGLGRGGGSGGRRLQSLLSGAEAVEIVSTREALQPGLYETWLVTEYCDQRTLHEAIVEGRLRRPGTREQDMMTVHLCLLDIALGMEYLHSDLNILHGDLKPANVLLKGARNLRGFTCKLADFGLSRLLGAGDTHVDTASVGTPSHSAPEALAHGRMTKPGDVYSFGVIAWELVAGEEPYPGMLAVQIILQVVQQQYRPPIPHACPPALAALIQRCWAQDPAERPTFAEVVREVKAQLTEWRREHGSGVAVRPLRPSTDSAMGASSGN